MLVFAVAPRLRETRRASAAPKFGSRTIGCSRIAVPWLLAAIGSLSGCAPSVPDREGYASVPGGRVWYRVVGHGPRPSLLVLHGGPGGQSCWLARLTRLADERPVVFYDQLGSGRSPAAADTSLWRLSRFVEEIDAVRSTLGLREVHLLGFSFGASIAAEYLLSRRPPGVRSVVFQGPLLSSERWMEDARRLTATLPDSLREVLEAEPDPDSPRFVAAMRAFNARYAVRHPVPSDVLDGCSESGGSNEALYRHLWGSSELRATGTLRSWDCTARLRDLQTPALVLVGDHDQVRVETATEFVRLLPRGQLAVIEDAGHAVHLDAPDAYVARLRAFLREVEGW